MVQASKTPLPGYGVATIDSSQYENVDFQGDDRFDTPQTGKLITLDKADIDRPTRDDSGITYGMMLEKKIYWSKYADQDATFHDDSLGDIVFIKLDKIVGFDA